MNSKVDNILKTFQCSHYKFDEVNFSIIKKESNIDTYHATRELIMIVNELNDKSIDYYVDENVNIKLQVNK